MAEQLIGLKIDPADAQAAADAVGKALGQLDSKVTSSGRAIVQSQGAGQPKRLVTLQLFSANRSPSNCTAMPTAATASSWRPAQPKARTSASPACPASTSAAGAGARSVVAGSVSVIKASSTTLAASLAPTGANPATLKELTQALSGFSTTPAKVEILKGRTVDGSTRLLLASLGEGQEQAILLVVHAADPARRLVRRAGPPARRHRPGRAQARCRASPRRSAPAATTAARPAAASTTASTYEGKIGEPIYAAADGVINHQGWYFNYGRTVKISHADNFETLYAHMSRFADWHGPGQPRPQRRPDRLCRLDRPLDRRAPALLGDRDGQFVDPAPYVSEKGGNSVLSGESLVAYRQWQQDVRTAAAGNEGSGLSRWFRSLQGTQPQAQPWSSNPFTSSSLDRL